MTSRPEEGLIINLIGQQPPESVIIDIMRRPIRQEEEPEVKKEEPAKPKAVKKGPGPKDDRLKFVFGTAVTGFAIYLLFAIIAYIFWWKTDQSLQPSDVFSSADVQVKNWSGKSGEWMARLIVYNGFGLASLLLPVMIGGIGLYMLNMRQIKVWSLTIKIAFAIIILSITLGFVFGKAGGFLGSGPGGAHGYLISQWLNAFMGKIGTGSLVTVAIVSYLIFALRVSPESIMKRIPYYQYLQTDKGSDTRYRHQ